MIFVFFAALIAGKGLEPMKQAEVLQALEQCMEVWSPAQENSREAFVWMSGLPNPFFNIVMHLSCNPSMVETRVQEAVHKAPAGTPMSFWVHPLNRAEGLPDALKKQGFQHIATCPLMSWNVSRLLASHTHDIRPADTRTFHELIGQTSQLDPVIQKEFTRLGSSAENYILYADGKPVTHGTLVLRGNVGGIFAVATLPEYQKRGYGKALMLFLMDRAYRLGLKTLVLLSSPVAEKLYRDLAFQKAFDVDVYAR